MGCGHARLGVIGFEFPAVLQVCRSSAQEWEGGESVGRGRGYFPRDFAGGSIIFLLPRFLEVVD